MKNPVQNPGGSGFRVRAPQEVIVNPLVSGFKDLDAIRCRLEMDVPLQDEPSEIKIQAFRAGFPVHIAGIYSAFLSPHNLIPVRNVGDDETDTGKSR